MSYKDEITDYNTYGQDIDKWIILKGEKKYMQFVKLLKQNNIDVKWNTLKDTYRYDKRLLVNLFKYLSFFEEFLRAQIWNASSKAYGKVENMGLRKIIDTTIELKSKINYPNFSLDNLIKNKELLIELRNRVSHNKIILTSTKNDSNINQIIVAFKNTLPINYQEGFVKDIDSCKKNLKIPKQLTIVFNS